MAYPNAGDVRFGVDRGDGTLGTLVVPAASDVKGGVAYGAGGTQYTGTYTMTYTAAANVRNGTDRGDGTTGTLVVPPAGNVRTSTTFDNGTSGTLALPAASDVKSGIGFGTGGVEFSGTYTGPTAYTAAANVRAGTDRGDGTTGTLAVPSPGQVVLGVSTDATVGTFAVPVVGQVNVGYQYGAAGTQYTGTLSSGGYVTNAYAFDADPRPDILAAIDAINTRLDSIATMPGVGQVAVDHDSGGAGNLAYVYQGSGVDGGVVRAYLTSDYDGGTYVIRDQTVTKADGGWIAPMYLDSGLAYTLIYNKQGVYGPSRKDYTVP